MFRVTPKTDPHQTEFEAERHKAAKEKRRRQKGRAASLPSSPQTFVCPKCGRGCDQESVSTATNEHARIDHQPSQQSSSARNEPSFFSHHHYRYYYPRSLFSSLFPPNLRKRKFFGTNGNPSVPSGMSVKPSNLLSGSGNVRPIALCICSQLLSDIAFWLFNDISGTANDSIFPATNRSQRTLAA